mgnify:CR=1 FL=1
MIDLIYLYRIANWCYRHHIPFIPSFMRLCMFIGHGSRIPAHTKIGKGTKFAARGMGVIMNGDEVIGEDCRIGHHVMMVRKYPYKECAHVGNHVHVGGGTVLMGNVIIGDNVIIGANSLVTKSVPEGCVVGGVPAKIIGYVKDLDYDMFTNPKYKEGFAPYLEGK